MRLLNFLVLIWPARSGGQMLKGQIFCRSCVSLRRRRGRQAVFREQFFGPPGLSLDPGAAARQSLGSSSWPTWAFTRARRGRQAVFRQQFFGPPGP